MSTQKHRFYRKILNIKRSTVSLSNGIEVPVLTIIWCSLNSQTKCTIKTDEIAVTTYIGSYKFKGLGGTHYSKPILINVKNPILSKSIIDVDLNKDIQLSFKKASRNFILNTKKLLEKTVIYE